MAWQEIRQVFHSNLSILKGGQYTRSGERAILLHLHIDPKTSLQSKIRSMRSGHAVLTDLQGLCFLGKVEFNEDLGWGSGWIWETQWGFPSDCWLDFQLDCWLDFWLHFRLQFKCDFQWDFLWDFLWGYLGNWQWYLQSDFPMQLVVHFAVGLAIDHWTGHHFCGGSRSWTFDGALLRILGGTGRLTQSGLFGVTCRRFL